MINDASYDVLNAGGSFGEVVVLTDAELGLILGGDDDIHTGDHYGPAELRQDLGTVASATGLGALAGGTPGALIGFGVGVGMVVEDRFHVVEQGVQFVSDATAVHNHEELPIII